MCKTRRETFKFFVFGATYTRSLTVSIIRSAILIESVFGVLMTCCNRASTTTILTNSSLRPQDFLVLTGFNYLYKPIWWIIHIMKNDVKNTSLCGNSGCVGNWVNKVPGDVLVHHQARYWLLKIGIFCLTVRMNIIPAWRRLGSYIKLYWVFFMSSDRISTKKKFDNFVNESDIWYVINLWKLCLDTVTYVNWWRPTSDAWVSKQGHHWFR